MLNYYINIKSSINFCLNSGDMYLSLSTSSLFVSQLIFGDAFVILSAILVPIKSPVTSAVF